MPQSWTQPPTVAVAGGGLAGLAAACALAATGFRVTLFERRPYLGGRASSYQHPGTAEVVDNCQHVLFGCCTNLIEFYRRIGVDGKIHWFDHMTFIEPGGRATVMDESGLPAPLHTAPSFLKFPFLELTDKVVIARALAAMVPLPLRDNGQSFLSWLENHGQTETAIQRFWKPILVSALNEEIDRVSLSSAGQVVRESLKSPDARHMGIPTIPLTDLYDAARDYIEKHGGKVIFRTSVESFRTELSHVQLGVGGREESFDYVVLALPFENLAAILPDSSAAQPLREALARFETSPITGIHLWFDREISPLEHAVLLDRTVQWMFHKSKLQKRDNNGHGSYVELVVSSSKTLVDKSKQEIVELAVKELAEFFPEVRAANLVKSTVIKEVHATYSPKPGIDVSRPRPETVWPRVFLAGDWTATGWPATMEGAVRSGYLAAQSLARVAGQRDSTFLVPDLPPTGFMRLFG